MPINIEQCESNDSVNIKIEISPSYYKNSNPFYNDLNRSYSSSIFQNEYHAFEKKQNLSQSFSTQENSVLINNSSIQLRNLQNGSNKFTSDNQNDYEIPIEINQDYMSQSKLNNISDKLNLNLDSLITREEKIFELETQALNKLISRDDETNFQKPIKDSIKFYNDQSIVSKKNDSFTLIKNVAPQKPSRKPEIKDNKESNGFDLIKVSIVNKRPISPDIEDILNGVDEDQYMDRSFVFADEINSLEQKFNI